jgi:hypothetical protein
MNDRIKELAKQAGDYVNETYTGPVRSKTPGKIWEDGHIGWHTQFNEKFAELIVRECMNIAKHHVMNISTYGDADFVDEQIKQHFGVEE